MNVTINKSRATGVMKAPPSKSMAHRYLICAALADGTSVIDNIELSEDIKATLDCIQGMGAKATVDNDKVTVEGIKNIKDMPSTDFMCRESGSTLRFFIPISMLSDNEMHFYGSKTLLTRPLSLYEDICKNKDLLFEKTEDYVRVKGRLTHDNYKLKGNISSQFITGLLFTLPLLEDDSVIELIPPVDSRSYINLTIQALNKFGVKVTWQNENTLYIKGNQRYTAVDVETEGDYSNAAFLEAFNYFGGEVTVTGLDSESLQGDKVYLDHFKELKAKTPVIDISDCPDLGPVLFTVAAVHNGGVFTGTRRLKIKESDRGTVMCAELAKFGVESKQEEDTITICKGNISAPKETVCGHNDHRIVMSMSLLLSLTGGTLTEAEAVRKSFPTFFECIKKLGIDVIL